MSNRPQEGHSTAPVFFGFVLRAAVAAAMLSGIAGVHAHAASDRAGYLTTGDGGPVTDASSECWRTAEWTRGMHYRQCDAPPAKTARAAPAVTPGAAGKAPQPRLAAASSPFRLSLDTLFDFDSAALKPQGEALLGKLADRIDRARFGTLQIVGHADRIGSDSYNQILSVRRADAVRDYLAARGLSRAKLSAKGVGDSEPVTAAGQCEGLGGKRLIDCLQPDRYVELKASGTASAAVSREILELESARPAA